MKEFQEFFCNDFPNSIVQNGKHIISYKDLFKHSKNLAKAFENHGIKPQEKLVIISQPSIEWILCDIACLQSGIITVPLFSNSSMDTLKYQIENCKPEHIVAENEEILQKIQNATSHQFKSIFLTKERKYSHKIQTIWNLIEEKNQKQEEFLQKSIEQSCVATIIYTSGTSGNPKGAVLTYLNFAHQITDIQSSFAEISSKDIAISILPFAHVFQRIIIYFYLSKGVNIHIINDIPNVLKYIVKIEPTIITIVPRVLEKVYARVKSQIEKKPLLIRKIFVPILQYSSKNIIKNQFVLKILDILFFRKVRLVFGKKMSLIVSGGAKLNANEEIFFRNAKLPVLQGYGMTECSPVIASNTKNHNKVFSVGKPFSSVEVKIAENGEICVRGGSVFTGYYGLEPRNPKEFFHTGDIGNIDYGGFLTVTGRLKEQFKNSNGKFVNPIKIESMLNEISGIDNACVVAEGRPFSVAVLFTQREDLEVLQNQIYAMNKHLEHHEQVQYWYITKEKPTIENNIITPSMKLRRQFVMERYNKEIEKLYLNIKKS
jgi:long-chain acyl-CoA synthetase